MNYYTIPKCYFISEIKAKCSKWYECHHSRGEVNSFNFILDLCHQSIVHHYRGTGCHCTGAEPEIFLSSVCMYLYRNVDQLHLTEEGGGKSA